MEGQIQLESKKEENGEVPPLEEKGAPREDEHFEEVIDLLGTFGHWQRVVFVFLCLPDTLGAFAMMVVVFTGATPNWSCLQYVSEQNGSTTVINGSAFPNHTMECEVEGNWKCNKFHFQDDFTSIVGEWELVCDRRWIVSLISSIQMIGLTLGAGIFGYLSDYFGRKKCFFFTILQMIVGGLGCAFTYHWIPYAVTRFVVGFGFGAYMVVGWVYPLEFVGPRWRTLCGTIGFWAIGIMLLGLVGYFIRDWRHLMIATSASGVVFLFTWWMIPESPRWLVQRSKIEEAYKIVELIAKKNNVAVPSKDLLLQISEKSRKELAYERMYTYVDLFRHPEYIKRTLSIVCFWFYGFMAYYTLSYGLRIQAGNRYLNMFLGGFVDLPAMISVIFFNNVIGRRGALMLYMSITIVVEICLVGVHAAKYDGLEVNDLAGITLGFGLLGRAAALAVTYVVQIYTAELYATVVRNLGVGAGAVAGRIGATVAPQMVLLGTYIKLAPYAICLCLGLLFFGLVCLLPETKGQPLDELPPGIKKADDMSKAQATEAEEVNGGFDATKC